LDGEGFATGAPQQMSGIKQIFSGIEASGLGIESGD
jgi:hypothetical protein